VAVAAVTIVLVGQWAAARPEVALSAVPAHVSAGGEVEALDDLMQQTGLPADVAAALARQTVRRQAAAADTGTSAIVAALLPGEGVHQ
jgi:hypothetical protein